MPFYRCMTAGGSGGGFEPSIQGVPFDTEIIRLPFTLNANYQITVDFEVDTYVSNMNIVGNNNGSYAYFNLTEYDNKYSTSPASGSYTGINFEGTLTGRHEFMFNDADNHILFDEVVVKNNGTAVVVNPASFPTIYYTIGWRNNTDFAGKIYRYTIYDKVNEQTVCDLKPYMNTDGALCLYDEVNHKIYTPQKRIK